MKSFTSQVGINDLPEVVITFILRLVPPYRDLKHCMLVNKYWCSLVRGVVKQRKQEFLNAIKSRNVLWEELIIGTDAEPTINKRYSHSACVHKDSLYVFGGCATQNTTFNDLWRLDLNTRKWIRLITTGTYPSPKACPSMVSLNDDIWLFGGLTFPAAYPYHQGFRMSKELHTYNSISNKWTLQQSVNSEPASMAGHSVTMQKERYMVIIGGSQMSDTNHHYNSSNSIWVFDIMEKKWDRKSTNAPAPLARFMHSQVKVDEDRMLILGGCSGSTTKFSDVWLLTIPEQPCGVWVWKEISVKNSHLRADILWRNPVVKVGSALVVLGCDSKTHESPPPKLRRCFSDTNRNRNHSSANPAAGSSEDNVNGRRGTFKRRLLQNRLQSESSSDEGESNLNSKLIPLLRGKNDSRFNINNCQLPNRIPHSPREFDFGGPGPSLCSNPPDNVKRNIGQLKPCDGIRTGRSMSAFRVREVPSMKQLSLHQNSAAPSRKCSHRRLQLYSIDISELLTSYCVSWLPKPMNQPLINSGPEELIKYSLAVGNSEMVIFGGTNSNLDCDSEVILPVTAASNCAHFISAAHFII